MNQASEKTQVELKLTSDLEVLRQKWELKDLDETYDRIVESWYMFDAHWLSMVTYLKNQGKLQ